MEGKYVFSRDEGKMGMNQTFMPTSSFFAPFSNGSINGWKNLKSKTKAKGWPLSFIEPEVVPNIVRNLIEGQCTLSTGSWIRRGGKANRLSLEARWGWCGGRPVRITVRLR